MFFMKTKKRVKKLEENVDSLEQQISEFYAKFEENNSNIINKLSQLQKQINSSPVQGTDNIDIKKLFTDIKKYIDDSVEETNKNISSQIGAIEKRQITKSDVATIIDEKLTQKGTKTDKSVSDGKSASVDYDYINKQISLSVSQSVNQALSQNLNQTVLYAVNQAVGSAVNNAVGPIISQEVSSAVKKVCDPLVKQIQEANRKNAFLELEVVKLKEQLDEINRRSNNKTDVIIKEPPITPVSNQPVSSLSDDRRAEKKHIPAITENASANLRTVTEMLAKTRKLEKQYLSCLDNTEDNQVYFRTVAKAKEKFEKLISKMNNKPLPSDKVANEIVKVLESTIIKNLTSPDLYSVVDKYLLECGFEKTEFMLNKKLTDDDYRYISDMPLETPVNERSKHNTIVEKKHDAYSLFYIDEDDGLSERVIAGDYVIGKYKEQ